jgi:hypothetical protein
VLSDEGILVDPTKAQEIMDWKAPTSVFEVQSFLGLACYYCRFILDFSKIANPMTRLLQKDEKFMDFGVWNYFSYSVDLANFSPCFGTT